MFYYRNVVFSGPVQMFVNIVIVDLSLYSSIALAYKLVKLQLVLVLETMCLNYM